MSMSSLENSVTNDDLLKLTESSSENSSEAEPKDSNIITVNATMLLPCKFIFNLAKGQ